VVPQIRTMWFILAAEVQMRYMKRITRLNRPETTTMQKVTTFQTMEAHGAMGLLHGHRGAFR
jgi:hypothetical protein